ncbi:hypothetical protein GPECTOR_11g262 [Gonium pectorale]|uniref:Uncharacterized protein n=1 Tax=Gonium pectorale TaxID=33097 RepID=A0A150GQ08_GONPE|nr:hypothetical protein GPECTOR_11g262 [Gonium pectorale]|eukprot:KXZ51822.1 hypothetical protein GPECTOR_11g262 [Gonium pectorale]
MAQHSMVFAFDPASLEPASELNGPNINSFAASSSPAAAAPLHRALPSEVEPAMEPHEAALRQQPYAVVLRPCGGGAAAAGAAARGGVDPAKDDPADSAADSCQEAVTATAAAATVLVVEPNLREIFRVSPSTSEYAEAVAALPEVWVGPRSCLLALARDMCDAMALNFRVQGLDVPPWRRRASVLDRWSARHPLASSPLHHTDTGRDRNGDPAAGADTSATAVAAAPNSTGVQPQCGGGAGQRALREASTRPAHAAAMAADAAEEAVTVSIGPTIAAITGTASYQRGCGANAGGRVAAAPPGRVTHGSAATACSHAPAMVVYGFELPSPAIAC